MNALNSKHSSVSLNSANIKDNDEDVLEDYNIDDDYIAIEDDIADTLKKAMDSSDSLPTGPQTCETLKKELDKLASSWPVEKTAKLMTLAFFTRLCT